MDIHLEHYLESSATVEMKVLECKTVTLLYMVELKEQNKL